MGLSEYAYSILFRDNRCVWIRREILGMRIGPKNCLERSQVFSHSGLNVVPTGHAPVEDIAFSRLQQLHSSV